MSERISSVDRATSETDIAVSLDLDGTGVYDIDTGVGFFDHMLAAFSRHSLIDLTVKAAGDTHIDDHHTVEDCGIVIGAALAHAWGDKRGIARFGSSILPMDEALVLAAVDISGRGQLHYDVHPVYEKVGSFDTQLAKEFFVALASNAGMTLHIRELAGENDHHVLEAAFKAVARALRQAVAVDARRSDAVPSTKGSLS